MGSLISGPKAPPAPPSVVYVPASTPTPQPAPESQQPSAEEQASKTRTDNLLTRSRGRLGTVLTSFRGFLGEKDTNAKRKTLLGE